MSLSSEIKQPILVNDELRLFFLCEREGWGRREFVQYLSVRIWMQKALRCVWDSNKITCSHSATRNPEIANEGYHRGNDHLSTQKCYKYEYQQN